MTYRLKIYTCSQTFLMYLNCNTILAVYVFWGNPVGLSIFFIIPCLINVLIYQINILICDASPGTGYSENIAR